MQTKQPRLKSRLRNKTITLKTYRIKTISEVHRSEIETDSKIDIVDVGSKNEIKVAAMLQLQLQKVATTPQ